MTLLIAPYTAGLSERIQTVRCFVGSLIKVIIVNGFVDTHSPENNGGMIPVLKDHFLNVFNSPVFPFFIAYMLPSRHLRKYHKTDFIAGIYKIMRLRIM